MSEELKWQRIAVAGETQSHYLLERALAPGGWLVRERRGDALALTFVPDLLQNWPVKTI